MSKAPPATAPRAQVSNAVGHLSFNLDWITRPVFGVILAGLALGTVFAGRWPFGILVGVAGIAALREWHRIVEKGVVSREFAISAAWLSISLAALLLSPGSPIPWLLLVFGAVSDLISARLRGARWLWHAAGFFYVGVPAMLLVCLRMTSHGAAVLTGLFLVVWSTDTGALVIGNLLGGPRLVPSLSPQKTWSGTVGGVVTACAVGSVVAAFFGATVSAAAAFAFLLSLSAHCGDLLESWVKRQFQFKNSGGLIPGHGGVLDRIDSTLAASLTVALAVFVFRLDTSFGAQL